jgi:hypothetical protein
MDLDRVPRIAASDLRLGRLAGRPCVVTGVADSWAAFARWTPSHLREVAGERTVTVSQRMGAPRNFGQSYDEGRVRFREYLDWVLETAADYADADCHTPAEVVGLVEAGEFEESYSLNVPLASLAEALTKDVAAPPWYAAPPHSTIFWCGVFGNSSGLHFDMSPNCNVQVRGRKHFALFSPSQTRLLYRYPDPDAHCAFDPSTPDFERFPLARRARGYECILREGEALYIPVGWYHQVTVLSPWALNVNFWWPRPFPQGLLTGNVWPQLGWRALRRLQRRGPR